MNEIKNEPKLTDEQLAALSYDKHIALTANAGSGKTFVFAKRFVKIAFEENPDLDKIIAITFTEKAAGELYSRIVKELNALAAKPGTDLRKLNKIRKKLVSAKISTIHSFCLSLLRDYSPQAGLDANLTPIQNEDREILLNKAFDDAIEDELGSPVLRELLRYFGSKRILRLSIVNAINKRRFVDKLYAEHYSKGKKHILDFINANTHKLFDEIILPQINDAIDFIRELNARLLDTSQITHSVADILEDIEKTSDSFEKIILLKQITELIETKDKKLSFKGYATKLDDKEELRKTYAKKLEFIRDFNFKSINENFDSLASLSENFFSFYNKVAEKFSDAKYSGGYLDFEDILIEANELLKNDEVLADLREKYHYIMVDEYQDTNELQYEIIMPILDKLKRGNLFVVGDEKQSIYMFNNAELEVFNRTKQNVNENKGEILELPHSFRLEPNNALFVNVFFSRIFANPNIRFNEVEFSPLIVSSEAEDGGKVEISLAVADKEIPTPSEAEILAAKIKQLIASKETKPGEIAVLTRQNKDVTEIEKALAKEKIPRVVIGGVGYFQELVIRDIQNYLMFLSSVNNDVALVSVLRSPFYAVSDADLFKISLEDGISFWEKLKSYAELRPEFQTIVSQLQEHILAAEAFEIPVLLNKILGDTHYWAVLASKENAEQEIANAKKLISFSLETLHGEATSLYEFAEKLNKAVAEKKDEGAAATDKAETAVKIMTYHRAKGLEFETVFLYKTNAKSKTPSVKSREITFDKDFGLIAKTPSPKGYFYEYESNPLAWMYQYYIRRKEAAEQKRLFYVGVTRAKKNLFIFAGLPATESVSKNSFFEILQNALNFTPQDASVIIEDELAFGNATNKRALRYEINIERNKSEKTEITAEEKPQIENPIIDTGKITDAEENEFVSATKIALYEFCPFNYKLTYELAFGKLYNLLDGEKETDFETREDAEENIPANTLGSVLHKALELEIDADNFEEKLDEAVKQTVKLGENAENIKTKAAQVLSDFMKSDIFAWLRNRKKYKNEYEIYLRDNDYFLYGIIDKLVFNDEKLIVVDYKSDKIKSGKFEEKFSRYENQLKFYLYILSKLYPAAKEFEAKLIFLNYPDNSITKNYSVKEISEFGEKIKTIVNKIRSGEFPKNAENCSRCVYYGDGNCVM